MDYNLKTISKVVGTAAASYDLGAEQIPAGMKRYVTFIKATNEYTASNTIFICSGTTATNAASGLAKDKQSFWSQYDSMSYPDKPSPDVPLFSVAESKYITARTNRGNMHIFMQYYDK